MLAIRSTINCRLLPVPCVQSYSVLTDTNKDSVFTRINLPCMDTQEVIPYLSAKYPLMDDICSLFVVLFPFFD